MSSDNNSCRRKAISIKYEVFGKYSNSKFHENLSSGSRVISYGQTDKETDRHDETNIRFSQFCERAKLDKLELDKYAGTTVVIQQ
jgi:hypothetical protein